MTTVRTWVNTDTGKRTNRITVRVEHRLSLHEMADVLCSQYVRHETFDGIEGLPDAIPAAEIIGSVREEYRYYGENAVWTWADDVHDSAPYLEWAKRVVINAFPEMGENR